MQVVKLVAIRNQLNINLATFLIATNVTTPPMFSTNQYIPLLCYGYKCTRGTLQWLYSLTGCQNVSYVAPLNWPILNHCLEQDELSVYNLDNGKGLEK